MYSTSESQMKTQPSGWNESMVLCLFIFALLSTFVIKPFGSYKLLLINTSKLILLQSSFQIQI